MLQEKFPEQNIKVTKTETAYRVYSSINVKVEPGRTLEI